MTEENITEENIAEENTKEDFVTFIESPHSTLSQINLTEESEISLSEIESCLEALIFLNDKPISRERLHQLLGAEIEETQIQSALLSLKQRFEAFYHGIELIEVAGGFQFRTKPIRAELIKKLVKIQTQKLSRGAMETLALVAYKQPVMKEEIDKIRGVDSTHFVRTLLERKMIQIVGRSELPGRPMLYASTPEFLELFGLKDLNALPSLHEIEQMVPALENAAESMEDPQVKEMRLFVEKMNNPESSVVLDYNPREDERILSEIRSKISAIPTSTPFIEEQKSQEKALAEQLTIAPESATDLTCAHE